MNTVGAIFTTPSEAHSAMLIVDSQMESTNRQWQLAGLGTVQNNPHFFPAAGDDFPSWDSFFQSWQAFAIEQPTLLSTSSYMDRLNDFTVQLKGWQAQLSKDTQGTVTPVNQATTPSDSGGLLGNASNAAANAATNAGRGAAGEISALTTPLLTIGAILLGGYAAIAFGPELLALAAHRR